MKLLLLLAALWLPLHGQVTITLQGGQVAAVSVDGKPFTDFFFAGPEVTKPYLHPLRAATGTYVTRMWPMAEVPNEPRDHKHQRGVWFAHAKVNGLDFWNNEASYTTPNRGKITLDPAVPVKVHGGKREGSITATFDWTDLKGEKLLSESRSMVFHSYPKLRIVDFDITLKAVTQVTFFDEKDGVFGIRMRPDLQEQKRSRELTVPGEPGHIVNADGLEGEKQLWGKPSNWCDYYGTVNGETVGIAILDHPANPRHPVRWHARGYGLFAANPFGLAVFTNDKSQNGNLVLEPGKTLRFRYRVIIHPGDTKSADIAGQWKEYAK